MHTIIKPGLSLILGLIISSLGWAQSSTETCDFFEEQNGLLVIEMESLPIKDDWETAKTIDGYTGSGYIQWTGNQYFNQIGNGSILFQVEINNPGTYNFNWRVAVGNGNNSTEHNDSWLKINGDLFFAYKGDINGSARLKPRPNCDSDPEFGCPNGSSKGGFFKVYGGNVGAFAWRALTSDNDGHNIAVRFDTAGVYSIEVNARSSYQCIDRMVLWNVDMQERSDAQKLNNPSSACIPETPTATEDHTLAFDVSIYPNPANDQFRIDFSDQDPKAVILRNYAGKTIHSYQTSQSSLMVNAGDLPKGLYIVEVRTGTESQLRRIALQ